MRNASLEESYTKYGRETISRLFSKKSKLRISLVQYSKLIYSMFFIACQVEGYRNILKVRWRPLAITKCKASIKSKTKSGTSLPALFSAGFLKENISYSNS